MNPIEVLMVEDNPGDVLLVQEAVAETGLAYNIHVVRDGVEAMEYLRAKGRHCGAARPDLVVLDLKLPLKGGREVLGEVRRDPSLHGIPIVLLSSSRSEMELVKAQRQSPKSCMVKPGTFKGYCNLVRAIESFRQETETTENKDPGHAH